MGDNHGNVVHLFERECFCSAQASEIIEERQGVLDERQEQPHGMCE